MSRVTKAPRATLDQFRALVAVMAEAHAAGHLPPTVAEEAFEELIDPLTMIKMNLDDGDRPWAMIQNLAELAGAVERFAEVLLCDLTEEKLRFLIAENQP